MKIETFVLDVNQNPVTGRTGEAVSPGTAGASTSVVIDPLGSALLTNQAQQRLVWLVHRAL